MTNHFNRPVEHVVCNIGPRPKLAARVALSLAMLEYAAVRAFGGDLNAWTCYLLPAYTGGPSSAAVDGRLRRPQCFGSRGEPWAQVGAAHCVEEMDQMPDVREVRFKRGGYVLSAVGCT